MFHRNKVSLGDGSNVDVDRRIQGRYAGLIIIMCNKSRLESLFLERKLEIIYLISSQDRISLFLGQVQISPMNSDRRSKSDPLYICQETNF